MDRAWMSANHLTDEYEQGIHYFCNFARLFADRNGSKYVQCPCMRCWNNKKVKVDESVNHLLLSGINSNYKVWRMHVLKLLYLKAKNDWSDKSFTELLQLVKEMHPDKNTLLNRTYEAKKATCPMGIGYKKTHACLNDCIFYRNDHSDLIEFSLSDVDSVNIRQHFLGHKRYVKSRHKKAVEQTSLFFFSLRCSSESN
ncbi:hypothetical protein QQ045_027249 [Rhodiola kirilowii]